MSIFFSCNSCDNKLRVSDDKAGKKAKCPRCGEVVTIPDSDLAPEAIDEEEQLPEIRDEEPAQAKRPKKRPKRPRQREISEDEREGLGWQLSWNPLTGIMYGPIPVGAIIVVIGLIIYFAV